MAENTTTRYALPYPSSSGKVFAGAEDFKELAEKLDEVINPVGTINLFGGTVAPSGWLLCEGQEVSRTTFSALFAKISTNFGSGNGTTTFNLPDMRERVPMGRGLGTGGSGGSGPTLGSKGGAWTAIAPVQSHTHTASQDVHSHNVITSWNTSEFAAGGVSVGTVWCPADQVRFKSAFRSVATGVTDASQPGVTVSPTGGSGEHTNLQPYTAVNYIIKT